MSATDNELSVEEYFRSIESLFLRLRGAPLLLSPADWKVAESWYEAGVPLTVAQEVMESLFSRLRERDPRRRISSLSYCAPAVEEAWSEIRALGETAGRLEPQPMDVPRRLQALREALPPDDPVAAEIAVRLQTLEGSAETVEHALQRLDAELLDLADRHLDSAARAKLDEQTRSALERALRAAGAEASTDLERRLFREFLRRHLSLPTLSLFGALTGPVE